MMSDAGTDTGTDTGLGTDSAAEAGVEECLWWVVMVQGYRFALADADIAGFVDGLLPSPVHHAPAWLAGVAQMDDAVVAVVDLGRFLGLCSARAGITVAPRPGTCPGWALRVHAVLPEPVRAAAVPVRPVTHESGAANLPSGLGSRPRPGFSHARITWVAADGESHSADVLDLARWADHPRLRELSR